jgi:hypothetical protein
MDIQGEHKWFSQFCKFIVRQSGKTVHPLDYNCQRFWIKVSTCNYNDLPPGALSSRKLRHLCKQWSVSSGLIKPTVRSVYNDAIGRNLEWIHLLCHPFMHSANSSLRHVVCVKGNVPLAVKCMYGSGNTNLMRTKFPIVHIPNASKR